MFLRKMARASIILIAIGAIIFPEAYWAHAGAWDSTRSLRRGSPESSPTIFLWRGQTMEGNITLSAPANFYILDEASYLAFVEDQSWQPLISLLGISNESFSFLAPTSGYYRIVVDLQFNQIESADLTISVIYYGTDRDHYDSGLAFASAGVFLGIIVLISFLRSKFSAKRAQGTGVEPPDFLDTTPIPFSNQPSMEHSIFLRNAPTCKSLNAIGLLFKAETMSQ